MINIDKYILQASQTYMHWQRHDEMLQRAVRDSMRQMIAEKLRLEFTEVYEKDFHTEMRVRIVAMPVKEFVKVVHDVAMQHRISYRDPL